MSHTPPPWEAIAVAILWVVILLRRLL